MSKELHDAQTNLENIAENSYDDQYEYAPLRKLPRFSASHDTSHTRHRASRNYDEQRMKLNEAEYNVRQKQQRFEDLKDFTNIAKNLQNRVTAGREKYQAIVAAFMVDMERFDRSENQHDKEEDSELEDGEVTPDTYVEKKSGSCGDDEASFWKLQAARLRDAVKREQGARIEALERAKKAEMDLDDVRPLTWAGVDIRGRVMELDEPGALQDDATIKTGNAVAHRGNASANAVLVLLYPKFFCKQVSTNITHL